MQSQTLLNIFTKSLE